MLTYCLVYFLALLSSYLLLSWVPTQLCCLYCSALCLYYFGFFSHPFVGYGTLFYCLSILHLRLLSQTDDAFVFLFSSVALSWVAITLSTLLTLPTGTLAYAAFQEAQTSPTPWSPLFWFPIDQYWAIMERRKA